MNIVHIENGLVTAVIGPETCQMISLALRVAGYATEEMSRTPASGETAFNQLAAIFDGAAATATSQSPGLVHLDDPALGQNGINPPE